MSVPRISIAPDRTPPPRNFAEAQDYPYYPPTPKKSNPLPESVRRLNDEAAQLSRDAEATKEEADAKIELARQFQQALLRPQNAVDNASDRLIRADNQFESHNASLSAMKESDAKNHWGNGDLGQAGQPSALHGRLFHYQTVVALTAAVEDFPRIRLMLVENINRAQTALDDYQAANQLS